MDTGFLFIPGKGVSIFPCLLSCRRHLCKDLEVPFDAQVKLLSLELNFFIYNEEPPKFSNRSPTFLVPGDVQEVSEQDKTLEPPEPVMQAPCLPGPILHDAVICKSNKSSPGFQEHFKFSISEALHLGLIKVMIC